ncbi:hypothetical protein SNL152K_8658 [Streptomyces sp. NL15-2K]|nr:hypothetical protein SNL152K_8658 [Streptomyces sp. NL15-2K]
MQGQPVEQGEVDAQPVLAAPVTEHPSEQFHDERRRADAVTATSVGQFFPDGGGDDPALAPENRGVDARRVGPQRQPEVELVVVGLVLPVLLGLGQQVAVADLLVLQDVVAVADAEVGQTALGVGVELRPLAEEDLEARHVDDKGVEADVQPEDTIEAAQHDVEQGVALRVVQLVGVAAAQLLQFGLVAQVVERDAVVRDLAQEALLPVGEDGAQGEMASDEPVERGLQPFVVDAAVAELAVDVRRDVAELEVVEAAQVVGLLDVGERERLVEVLGVGAVEDMVAVGEAPEARGDERGEPPDRLLSEDVADTDVAAQLAVDAVDEFDTQDAVAAGLEEVVGDAHGPAGRAGAAQHLGPQLAQAALQLAGGGDIPLGEELAGVRQRPAVGLAVGVQRHAVERDEHRRHHVVGQQPGQMAPQVLPVGRFGGHVVDDEIAGLVGGRVGVTGCAGRLVDEDQALLDGGVGGQRALDLAEFDAVSAQLDLEVVAADELQCAVRERAHQVTGAVEALLRYDGAGAVGRGRRGDEPARGQFRCVQVAAGQTGAGDAQLAHDPRGQRLQFLVEDVAAGVGDGGADQRAGVVGGEEAARGPYGGLRRAVHVPALVHGGGEVGGELRGQGLAAAQGAHGQPFAAEVLEDQMPQGRRRLDDGDAVRDQFDETGDVEQVGAAGQDDGAAVQERHVQLQRGDVEGDGGHGQHALTASEADTAPDVLGDVEVAVVLHGDALGAAGGAGGVDDVGEVGTGDPYVEVGSVAGGRHGLYVIGVGEDDGDARGDVVQAGVVRGVTEDQDGPAVGEDRGGAARG